MAIDLTALRAKLAAASATTAVPVTSEEFTAITTGQVEITSVKSEVETLNAEINLSELSSKIQTLDEALRFNHPTMAILLREIHTTLLKQPDNITLLKDEEINIIVNGLMKKTMTQISTKVMKSTKKSIKGISVDDL